MSPKAIQFKRLGSDDRDHRINELIYFLSKYKFIFSHGAVYLIFTTAELCAARHENISNIVCYIFVQYYYIFLYFWCII